MPQSIVFNGTTTGNVPTPAVGGRSLFANINDGGRLYAKLSNGTIEALDATFSPVSCCGPCGGGGGSCDCAAVANCIDTDTNVQNSLTTFLNTYVSSTLTLGAISDVDLTGLAIGNGISRDGANRVPVALAGGTDEFFKVSGADTTAGYGNDKIVMGPSGNLVKQILNGGGDEDLEIELNPVLTGITSIGVTTVTATTVNATTVGATDVNTTNITATGTTNVNDLNITGNVTGLNLYSPTTWPVGQAWGTIGVRGIPRGTYLNDSPWMIVRDNASSFGIMFPSLRTRAPSAQDPAVAGFTYGADDGVLMYVRTTADDVYSIPRAADQTNIGNFTLLFNHNTVVAGSVYRGLGGNGFHILYDAGANTVYEVDNAGIIQTTTVMVGPSFDDVIPSAISTDLIFVENPAPSNAVLYIGSIGVTTATAIGAPAIQFNDYSTIDKLLNNAVISVPQDGFSIVPIFQYS